MLFDFLKRGFRRLPVINKNGNDVTGINTAKAKSISLNEGSGRVAQHGLDAVTNGNHAKSTSLLSWGSRVQIPPRPPFFLY